MDKDTLPPQKLSVTICKITKIFVTWMNDLSLSVYVKKWINVFIVNKSILIYFTWFVYIFANYKCNILLKINNGKSPIVKPFFNKVGGCKFAKKENLANKSCFLLNFEKFSRMPILKNIYNWLLVSFRNMAEKHVILRNKLCI